ncbi:MAG: hypothetical protein R3B36_27620 [Polyangiaceae bacterium]
MIVEPDVSDAGVAADAGVVARTAPLGGSDPFDRGAAAKAFGEARRRAYACVPHGNVSNYGHVTVVFNGSGHPVSARLDRDPIGIRGTSNAKCIERAFLETRVPPFSGGDVTVGMDLRW